MVVGKLLVSWQSGFDITSVNIRDMEVRKSGFSSVFAKKMEFLILSMFNFYTESTYFCLYTSMVTYLLLLRSQK